MPESPHHQKFLYLGTLGKGPSPALVIQFSNTHIHSGRHKVTTQLIQMLQSLLFKQSWDRFNVCSDECKFKQTVSVNMFVNFTYVIVVVVVVSIFIFELATESSIIPVHIDYVVRYPYQIIRHAKSSLIRLLFLFSDTCSLGEGFCIVVVFYTTIVQS